ncbi:hypothetical protein ColKHC_07830 [Colletotrichum higginsianum]|nr:hypothetical protein ColKHC_07830 [Colletotrichum higginsianum]
MFWFIRHENGRIAFAAVAAVASCFLALAASAAAAVHINDSAHVNGAVSVLDQPLGNPCSRDGDAYDVDIDVKKVKTPHALICGKLAVTSCLMGAW